MWSVVGDIQFTVTGCTPNLQSSPVWKQFNGPQVGCVAFDQIPLSGNAVFQANITDPGHFASIPKDIFSRISHVDIVAHSLASGVTNIDKVLVLPFGIARFVGHVGRNGNFGSETFCIILIIFIDDIVPFRGWSAGV
jgi:hypothetical protein